MRTDYRRALMVVTFLLVASVPFVAWSQVARTGVIEGRVTDFESWFPSDEALVRAIVNG